MSGLETSPTAARSAARPAGVLAPFLVFGALLLAALWNLGASAPWWDEGWTLSVARNLAEHGLYARLLDGAPAPIGRAHPGVDRVADGVAE